MKKILIVMVLVGGTAVRIDAAIAQSSNNVPMVGSAGSGQERAGVDTGYASSEDRSTGVTTFGVADPSNLVAGQNPYTSFKVPEDLTVQHLINIWQVFSTNPSVQVVLNRDFAGLTNAAQAVSDRFFALSRNSNANRLDGVVTTFYDRSTQQTPFDAITFAMGDVAPLVAGLAQSPEVQDLFQSIRALYQELQRLMDNGVLGQGLRSLSPELVKAATQVLPGARQQIYDAIDPQGAKLKEAVGQLEAKAASAVTTMPFVEPARRQALLDQVKQMAENLRADVEGAVMAAKAVEVEHQSQ